jgi:hypothetical protein
MKKSIESQLKLSAFGLSGEIKKWTVLIVFHRSWSLL